MKPARSILCAALAVGMGGIPLTLQAAGPATTKPAAVVPAAQQPAETRLAAQVQAIRQAQDPSAAIQAYHDASAGGPADVAVEQAYVTRMVDFGLPEMADAQAQDVIRRNPQDGLSWAVAAYMSAKRDQNDLALKDVATAVRLDPGNTFVLRTAGQVTAWYDTQPGQTRTPEEARASLAAIKAQLAGNSAYAEAYRSAGEAYRQLASADTAAPATQPAAPEEQKWVSTYPYSYRPTTAATTQPPPDTGVSDETAGGYTYNPTYVPPATNYTTYNDYYYNYPNPYVSYPYYSDWWPGPFWGASWWWPTFGSVVIIDNNFHHHHHDGFHCNDPAFFNHHGHNFNFVRHDGNTFAHGRHGVTFADHNHGGGTFADRNHDGTFVGHTRGGTATVSTRLGRDTLASGTPLHRQSMTPSWQRSGGGSRVLVPDHRGGAMSAWTGRTPAFAGGGGGRHFTPTPMRTGPSAGFGRSAPMPHSPSFGGGGARFGGGGAHFGGGGNVGGGGGAHFGGGGGGHFGGGGGGGGHFGGGGGGHR